MAKKEITELIDDLDGTTTDVETVTFQLDGVSYAIELCRKNAERLRKLLRRYAEHARRAGRRRATPPRTAKRRSAAPASASSRAKGARRGEVQSLLYAPEVREWALAQGMSVGRTGRMPDRVVEEYLNRASRKRRRG